MSKEIPIGIKVVMKLKLIGDDANTTLLVSGTILISSYCINWLKYGCKQ